MDSELDWEDFRDNVFRFYARMYDAAYELVEEFARDNAASGVYDPEAPGWQEYVGELALLAMDTSTSAFRRAEDRPTGLKYLYDTGDDVLTRLDDELDPISGWVSTVTIELPSIGPYVNHPLPEKHYWY